MSSRYEIKNIFQISAIFMLGILIMNTAYAKDSTTKLGNLELYTSLDIGLEEAQKQKKPMFIYIRTDWCAWCKKFESETFTNGTAINLLNENFILTTIDFDAQRDLAVNLGARGTPTFIFIMPNGIEIPRTRTPGYVSTDAFVRILNIAIQQIPIPTSTPIPTMTVTSIPTPTPTLAPMPAPTVTPVSTVTSIPTVTPTPTPTPTPMQINIRIETPGFTLISTFFIILFVWCLLWKKILKN